uniref:Adenylate kinase 7a n=1 Tax=Cyprinus carpio TaxID=7962 RepID=A0A8C1VCN8_CYPCA
GMGKNIFHFFFKTAWLGELNSIPVSGPGTNIIPAIHIHDLARFEKLVVQNFIDHKPKTHNFIAVDDSKNTFEDIVKVISIPLAIASTLGSGKIENVPKEDAYGTKAITETDLLYLGVNLRTESVFLKDRLNLHWECESGIVDNISQVLEEYKQTRQLLPIKICLLGPPAVGKSSVAVKLCRQYKLHHIDVNKTINEKVRRLVSEIYSMSNFFIFWRKEAFSLAQTLCSHCIRSCLLNIHFRRNCLREMRRQARTRKCTLVLNWVGECCYMLTTTEFIISPDATDEFLKERVQSLPQNVGEEMHYTQDEFTESLAQFRETLAEDESYCIKLLNELTDKLIKIIKTVGRPKNYGPSPEELEEERKRKEDERHQQLKQEEIEEELRKRSRNMVEVKKQEHELLETQSVPMRHDLMKYVMPTVMQGLMDCGKVKPGDPVDFLAEYLFRNNSDD